MPKRTPHTASVDLTGLQAHFKRLEGLAIDKIDAGFTRLEGEAASLARDIIDQQIYRTPERGYERTGKLGDSIYAFKRRAGRDSWEIVVGAYGGAGGRLYALYNERGTYGARVTLESILQRALAASSHPIQLEYGRPGEGLEPRPWVIPSIVMISRRVPAMVLQAVRDAEKEANRGQDGGLAMAAD